MSCTYRAPRWSQSVLRMVPGSDPKHDFPLDVCVSSVNLTKRFCNWLFKMQVFCYQGGAAQPSVSRMCLKYHMFLTCLVMLPLRIARPLKVCVKSIHFTMHLWRSLSDMQVYIHRVDAVQPHVSRKCATYDVLYRCFVWLFINRHRLYSKFVSKV